MVRSYVDDVELAFSNADISIFSFLPSACGNVYMSYVDSPVYAELATERISVCLEFTHPYPVVASNVELPPV